MNDPMSSVPYRVTVSYREPDYEARVGPRLNPYRWTYTIVADGEEQARLSALLEFRQMTMLSSVGWHRVVVGVDVAPALPVERTRAAPTAPPP